MKKSSLKFVQEMPLAKLKPHRQNARVHSPEQLSAIAKLLQEFGWARPLLVDEHMTILAGHGTRKAAMQLGWKTAPVIVRSGLTEAQKRAYVLADNAVAARSSWDLGLLGDELSTLGGMGIDLALTGFDPKELASLLAPPAPPETEPPIPEAKSPAVTRVGDVWALGRHRVICGDATKPSTLEALMKGQLAQVVFTDPPYGVSYVARSGRFEMIAGDDLRRGELLNMLTKAFQAALPHTKPDAGWYVWHASSTREDFSKALRDTGISELGYIIWAKPQMVLGWSDYRWAHEPCFYASRQGVRPAYYGDGTDTTVWRTRTLAGGAAATTIGTGVVLTTKGGQEIYVSAAVPKGRKVRHIHLEGDKPMLLTAATDKDDVWEVSRDNGHGRHTALHANQKPVELGRRAIRNSSQEGEIVVDMFGGSGSTLIGAEQTNRCAFVVELDPAMVDVIVRRWQDFTKLEATTEDGKHTYAAAAKGKAKARAA